MRARAASMTLSLVLMTLGCAHKLEVMNLQDYAHVAGFRSPDRKLNVAVAKSSIDPAALWLYNAVLRDFSGRREVGHFTNDPGSAKNPQNTFNLAITPAISFDASGWNFIVNWPGGLIFTPAWHGYNYVAEISTTVSIHDEQGKLLRELKLDTPYDFRHADFGHRRDGPAVHLDLGP